MIIDDVLKRSIILRQSIIFCEKKSSIDTQKVTSNQISKFYVIIISNLKTKNLIALKIKQQM
jgi:hypothetical protein